MPIMNSQLERVKIKERIVNNGKIRASSENRNEPVVYSFEEFKQNQGRNRSRIRERSMASEHSK